MVILFVGFSEVINTPCDVHLQRKTIQMSFVLIYYISNHCIGGKWSFLWENPFSHTASVTGSEVFCCSGGSGVIGTIGVVVVVVVVVSSIIVVTRSYSLK